MINKKKLKEGDKLISWNIGGSYGGRFIVIRELHKNKVCLHLMCKESDSIQPLQYANLENFELIDNS